MTVWVDVGDWAGVVGGSDFVKQKEQLGETGERRLLDWLHDAWVDLISLCSGIDTSS
jgi:hypothetical protein